MTDRSTARPSTRRDLLRGLAVLGGGAAVAVAATRVSPTGHSARAQADDAAPTKTRQAELDELDRLRTQVPDLEAEVSDLKTRVAQLEGEVSDLETRVVPTETPVPPTATATTVPAAATGEAIAYGDELEVIVLGIAPVPAAGGFQPQGQLLQLNLTVVNRSTGSVAPPFLYWQLVDAAGQVYRASPEASSAVLGARWAASIPPGESADRAVIFDVLPEAGTAFTLESSDQAAFRVSVEVVQRG